MKIDRKTKKQLIAELSALKKKVRNLERACQAPQSDEILERLFSNTHLPVACPDPRFRERDSTPYLHLFRTLMDRVSDAIYVSDPLTGRIIDVNERACEMLGYARSEMLRLGVGDVQALSTDRTVWSGILRALEEKGSVLVEGRHRRKDGSEFPVEVQVRRIELEGKEYTLGLARDITERKNREQDLRKERDFRTAVLETVDAIIVTLDREGRIVTFNRACERVTGYSFAEAQGRHVWDFLLPPEQIESVKRVFGHLATGFPVRSENVWITREGGRRLIAWSNTALFDDEGNPEYVIATGIDVTDSRTAGEALKASEERFRTIYEKAPVMIGGFDGTGQCILWNRECERNLGWPGQETAEKMFALICPDPEERKRMQEIVRKADGVFREFTLRAGDGRDRVQMWANFPLAGNMIICVGYDITDRKQAEATVLESELRYRSLIDAANDAILVADIETGILIEANRQAETLFARPAARIIGMHQTQLHPPEEAERYRRTFESSVRQKKGLTEGELYIINSRGERIPVEISVNQFESGGRRMILGVFRDITERRQRETALKNAYEEARKFQRLVEYAEQAIGMAQLDSRMIYGNSALMRILDVPSLDVLRQHSFQDFYTGCDLQFLVTTAIPAVYSTGSWQGEVPLRSVAGRIIPTIHSMYLVKDGEGKPAALCNIITDITERKRGEDELRKAKQFTDSLIRTANVIVVVLNNKGVVVQINEAGEKITGYDRSEVIGRSWFDVLAPRDRYPETYEQFAGLIQAKSAVSRFTNEILIKSGEERIISWQNSTLGTDDGLLTVSFGIDITEQVQAERRLRQSEERLRRAQQVAHVGSWELDLLTGELIWSDEVFRIFEIDPRKFSATYEAFLAMIHPEDREMVHEAYTRSLRDRTPYDIVHRIITDDGRVKYVREICETAFDDPGKPLRSLGTIQDITEQRMAQEALRESRERLTFVISNSPAMIYTCAASGEFAATFMSSNCSQHLGYHSSDFTGDPGFWARHIHPDDRQRVFADLGLLFKKGSHSHEYRFLHRDGSWRWMRDDLTLVRDAGGRPFEIIGSWVDITGHKIADEALRRSEERFRSIAETLPDLIYRLRTDGFVTYVSPSVRRIAGFSLDEVIERHFLNFIHDDDHSAAMKAYDRLLAGETVTELELRLRTKDKGFIYAAFNIVPIKKNGDVIEIQGVIRDITERKRTEERMLQSLLEKETLLQEIHHRVKNNLQIISSLLFLQSEKIRDPEVMDLFRESRDRIQSMAIVHEKLYRSKDLSRVDLAVYLNSLASYLVPAERTEAREVEIDMHVDNVFLEAGLAVPCGLILNELISNALKHAFPKRRRGATVRIDAFADEMVHLTVSDNGTGLPPGLTMEKSETLGLRLVHNLVRQLHGSIEVTSDHGALFSITFPYEKKSR